MGEYKYMAEMVEGRGGEAVIHDKYEHPKLSGPSAEAAARAEFGDQNPDWTPVVDLSSDPDHPHLVARSALPDEAGGDYQGGETVTTKQYETIQAALEDLGHYPDCMIRSVANVIEPKKYGCSCRRSTALAALEEARKAEGEVGRFRDLWAEECRKHAETSAAADAAIGKLRTELAEAIRTRTLAQEASSRDALEKQKLREIADVDKDIRKQLNERCNELWEAKRKAEERLEREERRARVVTLEREELRADLAAHEVAATARAQRIAELEASYAEVMGQRNTARGELDAATIELMGLRRALAEAARFLDWAHGKQDCGCKNCKGIADFIAAHGGNESK